MNYDIDKLDIAAGIIIAVVAVADIVWYYQARHYSSGEQSDEYCTHERVILCCAVPDGGVHIHGAG